MSSQQQEQRKERQQEKSRTDEKGNRSAGSDRTLLGLLTIGQFVVVLDFTIIQIALPAIRTSLHVDVAGSTWLISGYGLVLAGLLILSGRVGDIYGRKKFFVVGLLVFGASSFAGGVAPSFEVLLAARVVQGVGAALAAAAGLSLIVVYFPEGERRNRALAVFTAAAAGAFGAGLILGGVLTAAFSWRAVMFVNVPIAIISAILSVRYIGESKGKDKSEGLDIPGAAAVTSGLMVLDFGLTNALTSGIADELSIIPIAVSGCLFLGFLFIERRSRSPLVSLGFLKRRTILSANSAALSTAACVGGMLFIMVLYLQEVLKYSVLLSGLAFAPAGLMNFVMGGFVSRSLVERVGMKLTLAFAAAAQVAGFVWFSQISPNQDYFSVVLPAILVVSLGTGIAYPAFRIAATSRTRKGEEGMASGLINTSQQIGSPLGVTALMTVASAFSTQLSNGQVTSAAVTGFHYAFIVAAGLGGLSFVMASLMHGRNDTEGQGKEEETKTPASGVGSPRAAN